MECVRYARKSALIPAAATCLAIIFSCRSSGSDSGRSQAAPRETTRDFEADPSLTGAAGQVHAKTGTYVGPDGGNLILKGEALAGYVRTKNGKPLAFSLVVNHVPVHNIDQDVLQVSQDQSSIAAMLWRDF